VQGHPVGTCAFTLFVLQSEYLIHSWCKYRLGNTKQNILEHLFFGWMLRIRQTLGKDESNIIGVVLRKMAPIGMHADRYASMYNVLDIRYSHRRSVVLDISFPAFPFTSTSFILELETVPKMDTHSAHVRGWWLCAL
jgi:hypothetical protein